MFGEGTQILRDFWYLAMPGRRLPPGAMTHRILLGEPVLLGRTETGEPFALRDICPHRGIPLHYGRFDGREVTCGYHGWKFAPDGSCTEIPSLMPDQDFGVSRIHLRSFPCREVQGLIWVHFGEDGGRGSTEGDGREDPLPDPPVLPISTDARPRVDISMPFPCHADHAAFGLMDPTHAAFVHTSWWWKKKARVLRPKEKEFEPAPLGWRMKRHRLPPENRLYRLFGKVVTTEISYRLPGLRIEHIEGERHTAVGLTAITPLEEGRTEVHQVLFWTIPWLGFARPLLERMARTFLGQDRDVVVRQQEGLAYDPPLMLVDDADTQAKWYHKLKREWLRAREEGRPFRNPIEPATLRWMS